jgi:hypothetical protein
MNFFTLINYSIDMCWSWQVTTVYTCITFSFNFFENCFESPTYKKKIGCLAFWNLKYCTSIWTNFWSPLCCPNTIIARLKRGTYFHTHVSTFTLCLFCPKSFFFLQTEVVMCFIMVLASQLWFFHPLVNRGFSDFTNDHHHHHHHHQHTILKTKKNTKIECIQIC